ncbi:acetylcholine receptor subunit beta-type unc-29-like isoform X1 [Dreissena polymorpha]|nr:acetylcholine receptor subunit beta-type unc-29-like isoform X1 [Dreissena polymorpha]
MARPNTSTTASVGYNIMFINDVDSEHQVFECTGWFTVIWYDGRLQWKPSVYDDTNFVHALETEIWKPELIVTNAQNNMGLISDNHLIYRINSTGTVSWEPLLSTATDCSIDVTYFPFDNQTCIIELTSWSLPWTELKLEPLWNSVHVQALRASASWELIETYVEKSSVAEDSPDNVTEYFSKLNFVIRLRRKPGNYMINTITPMIVSSFLMTFTHVIPTQSGERLITGFIALAINTLLWTIFTDQIPNIATTTSTLGIYLMASFCIDCAHMLAGILVVRLYYRPTHIPINLLWRSVAYFLGCLLRVTKPPKAKEELDDSISIISIPTDDLKKIEKSMRRNVVYPENCPDGFTERIIIREDALPQMDVKFGIDLPKVKRRKMKASDTGYALYNDVNNETKTEKLSRITWRYVSLVLDRLVFLVFLGVKIGFNVILIGRLFQNHE